jgi:hypothetical protein
MRRGGLARRLVKSGIPGLLAVACASDSPSGSAGFVQVTELASAPNVSQCGVLNPSLPYELTIDVGVVNTTREDVFVTNVSSTGFIVASADSAELGLATHMFGTLSYVPSGALLTARTGNVELRVTLQQPCGPGPDAGLGEARWRETNTIIYVTTTAGQFTSLPFVSRINWQ